MTIHELRYFIAVAETGSFTSAARQTGVTQPSLSQQISQLERAIGNRLFDRLPRKVILTAAGRTILPHARSILATLDSLRGIVQEQSNEVRGPLAIAATSTLAPFIIADAVAKFVKLRPRVELSLYEMPAPQIVNQIKTGECDLGIVGMVVQDQQILIEPLFSESLIVAIRKRHRLSSQTEITLDDLSGETLILIDELREIAAPLLAKPTSKNHVASITGAGLQLATIEALVAAGAGICLLPAMARSRHDLPGIVYRPIRGRAPIRTVSAIWHRDRVRARAAQLFMDTLRKVISASL